LLVGDLVPSPIEYNEFFVLDVDANASRGVSPRSETKSRALIVHCWVPLRPFGRQHPISSGVFRGTSNVRFGENASSCVWGAPGPPCEPAWLAACSTATSASFAA